MHAVKDLLAMDVAKFSFDIVGVSWLEREGLQVSTAVAVTVFRKSRLFVYVIGHPFHTPVAAVWSDLPASNSSSCANCSGRPSAETGEGFVEGRRCG